MESLGLMPSETGRRGGARVGQAMDQYVVPGGTFEAVFASMPHEWLLPFLSGTFEEKKKDLSKSKFVCTSCGDIARGKPGLEIDCRKCRAPFALETTELEPEVAK